MLLFGRELGKTPELLFDFFNEHLPDLLAPIIEKEVIQAQEETYE